MIRAMYATAIAEFKVKNIVKAKLLNEIEEARNSSEGYPRAGKQKTALDNNYPLPINGEMVNTEYFLVYLLAHLNYHIGQINYLRRLVAHVARLIVQKVGKAWKSPEVSSISYEHTSGLPVFRATRLSDFT